MTCDRCNQEAPLRKVNIKTGKRGRPPVKLWCETCITEHPDEATPKPDKPETLAVKTEATGIRATIEKELKRTRKNKPKLQLNLEGFDPAALFLLAMSWHNLFEPADNAHARFRCKGCRDIVPSAEREWHYNMHKGKINSGAPIPAESLLDEDDFAIIAEEDAA